ncbi:NADH-quinone oxidoreductase subunit NuoN [Natronosporangium hydrolyticum]|uniref:NADH-quinone oxidoreductase subunit N n=1 Tax=Natronosporangium hydrolyticum TaxID=2811111 RepID=A0A895YID4_9ACTN|nr:NADH-quinone oxidoreductase subunit NuoN [Natronosporangium hydrolyticum]QSB14336.1 NADH-quinone oxidoreductase subunit NuoN [Natronosporangium hydrolyticum]
MPDFTLPSIDYLAISPLLILFGAACVGVLVEALVPRQYRHPIQLGLSLVAVLVALVMVIRLAGTAVITAGGSVTVDGPALFMQGALFVFAFVALLLIGERRVERQGAFVAQAAIPVGSRADTKQLTALSATEVYPLTLFSLGGMALFISANDLLTMFIALEVLSLPLYLMCALARRQRLISQEAAVKYFLLGAYASAFFLFGVALAYGFAGSVDFADIHAAIGESPYHPGLVFAALALIVMGLLFKAAAAPFHVWTPDVYQGAPTPIVAFMAAGTKVAAFGALLRVTYVAFEQLAWEWLPIIGVIAVLTMMLGAILAVTQTDIKRLLAYSWIANAGYVLVGVLAVGRAGASATMFYLVAYGFAVLAAFAVITLVRDKDGETPYLARWAGLGRNSPLIAGAFTLVMLALAGIPLTAGFTAKFAVFSAALAAGEAWLVIAGVLSSLIIAFPYLRVVVMMWLSEPTESTSTVAKPGILTGSALAIGVAAIVVLGVAPGPVLDLAHNAAVFLR